MTFSLLEPTQWPPLSSFLSFSLNYTGWSILLFSIVLFALTNFKSMPGVWTWRVLFTFRTSFNAQLRQTVQSPSADNETRRIAIVRKANRSSPIKEHPLFRPTIYSTHAPIAEIDINLHKSNSTYFTDLDVARSKLMGRILAPAWPMENMLIEYTGRDGTQRREKVQGSASFILGATYTSFKREVGAYTWYNVESRVLGWDTRWLYIGSWFVDKKDKKKLYACSLSKYILKKGRITVRPDLFLAEAGWIPSLESGSKADSSVTGGAAGDMWTWDDVEAQRKLGMAIVDSWGDTDLRLEECYFANVK